MVSLNQYLPSLGINLEDWVLTSVSAISADGRTLAGEGRHFGQLESWVFMPTCYPDCDGDSLLTLADFGCFQTKFGLGDPYADCDGDAVLTLADFGCFQTKFGHGCP